MGKKPKQLIENGMREIKPLLEKHGFKQSEVTSGSSSGGDFAACDFINGKIEIGIIVRASGKLGCPSYTAGHGYAAHERLLSVLGHSEKSSLIPGKWPSYVSKKGNNAFDALFRDLSELILPLLRESPQAFEAAINRAKSL